MQNLDQLSSRQKFILNVILEKNSLNISQISKQFDVSSRTITREINFINKILKPKGIKIYENNLNLSIMAKKKDIDYLRKSLDGIPPQWLLNQEQRLILITSQLLLADESYKLAFFSYQLNVSEGTISLYMDKIESWLRVRYLTLDRKRGHGMKINGSEWIKRNSIVELIYRLKPIDELCSYVYGNNNDTVTDAFFKLLFGHRFVSISKKIMSMFEKNVFKMDDTTYLSSLIHLLVSLKKTELGSSIEFPSYLIEDVISSKRFDFASNIKEYLESEGIMLTDSELTYVVIHLFGYKYIYNKNRKFEEFGVSFEDISRELLYEVEKRLGIKINCDKQLIAGLSQHINSALYRVNMDMPVKNTILNEIREYYKKLFEIVSYACKLVFSKYNINMPLDEIGFITMHVGASIERTNNSNNKFSALVICPNGLGTAKILSSKIKSVIHNIDNIKIESFKDWSKEDKKYDIVFSTTNIDLKGKRNQENVIMVSPFLKKSDIDNINNYISKLIKDKSEFNKTPICPMNKPENNDKKNSSGDPDLHSEKCDIIDDLIDSIRLENVDADSFEQLINIIAQNAYDNCAVSDREEIEKLIIAREKLGNVVVPNSHIALLHTRSNCVTKPFIGVYRLQQSMKLRSLGFDYENVDTFMVLLAKRKENSYVLEQMGKLSINLIENKKLPVILRNKKIENICNEMRKILYREDI